MTVADPEQFLRRSGRFELKFVVPTHVAHRVRERLSHFMQLDGNAGERGFYFNRSLYFDSPAFTEYADYINGERRRRKVRLRRYGLDSEVMNFELKHKLNKIVWKDKIPCSYEDAIDLCARAWNWVEHATLGPTAAQLLPRTYEPKLTVVYQRIPLADIVSGGLRVTFDSNIRCGPPEMFLRDVHSSDLRVLAPGFEVIEAKFRNSIPNWFRKIISDFQLSARVYSKYALSVDRLYDREKIVEDIARHG